MVSIANFPFVDSYSPSSRLIDEEAKSKVKRYQ